MFITEIINRHKEIAYYKSLPVLFDGFYKADGLGFGAVRLACVEKRPGDMILGYVPAYYFEMRVDGNRVGAVSLRVGYSKSLYFTGQIGYAVDAPHRGNGYAGDACRALIPLMLKHGMIKVLITNNTDNLASRRVCEKLGAKFIRVAKIPCSHEQFEDGARYKNIFEWNIV